MEQQRVIRKLLRKENAGELDLGEVKLEDNVESVESDTEEETTLEISISVPNLSDIVAAGNDCQTTRPLVQIQRSISDSQVREMAFKLISDVFIFQQKITDF